MFDQRKNFLERLQESGNGRKDRWVIGLSVLATLAVVFVWLGYFNTVVPGIDNGIAVAAPVATEEPFFNTVQRGAASFFHSFKGLVGHALGLITRPQTIMITPDEPNQ